MRLSNGLGVKARVVEKMEDSSYLPRGGTGEAKSTIYLAVSDGGRDSLDKKVQAQSAFPVSETWLLCGRCFNVAAGYPLLREMLE